MKYKRKIDEWEFYVVDESDKEIIVGTKKCVAPRQTSLYKKVNAMGSSNNSMKGWGFRIKDRIPGTLA